MAAGAAAAGCLPDVGGEYDKSFCSYTEPTVTPGDPTFAGLVVEEQNLNIIAATGHSLNEAAAKLTWGGY